MALSEELLILLDNDEEPLPKRLKIADNAFKSYNLPLQHREGFLLQWLSKITKTNNTEAWNLLLKWLQSVQIHNLSRSDISYEDLRNLNNVLNKRLKNVECSSIIIDCILEIIQNKNFQVYFKHNLSEHCSYIGTILSKIKCPNQLHKFVTNEHLFSRNITSHEDFYKHFITSTLPFLSRIVTNFPNDIQIFTAVSDLTQKCIFRRNFNTFSTYFIKPNDENESLPKFLFEYLGDISTTDDAFNAYSLMFHAFCKSYSSYSAIFNCFTLLLNSLGFNITPEKLPNAKKFESLELSVAILTRLCIVLTECDIQLSTEVGDKTISGLLEDVTNFIMNNLKPCKATYNFLSKLIVLDPILIKNNLSAILKYVLLHPNDGVENEYEHFILSLFEIFGKLHRISDLLTVMMTIIKSSVESNHVVVPSDVLNFFTQSILTLPSWQIIKLFKILLANLDDAVNNLSNGNHIYLEFVGTFLCQFLSSVRIAEYTVPSHVVRNFEEIMLELKEVLKRFGTTLVSVEHKPNLMRAYLNICFKWGELYILLAFYCNEVTLRKNVDSDVSACNITYLHSYLDIAQWRLISQRITNFGEKPCKQIMQNLCIQKLRAMILFETEINPDIITSVVSNVITSIDEQSNDLLFNDFVLNNIIIPNSMINITEVLLKAVVKTKDFHKLQMFNNNKDFISEILQVCFRKLNKAFTKNIRQHCITSRMLTHIDKNVFIEHNLSSIVNELQQSSQMLNVNENELCKYLEVIKSIPIPLFDNKHVQEVVLIYLIGLCLDLQNCSLQNQCIIRQFENIVKGIAQNSGSLAIIFESKVILPIVNHFESYRDVFTIIMQGILKNKSRLESFKSVMDKFTQNVDNDRHRECSIIFLNYIDKFKSKVADSEKSIQNVYREQICKCLLPLLTDSSSNTDDLVGAYALTLKYYLNVDSKEVLSTLLPLLNKYMNVLLDARKRIEGALLLLTVVIHKKSQFECVEKGIVLKVWDCCHQLIMNDDDYERFSKIVRVTLQVISDETFTETSAHLLTLTLEKHLFREKLHIWNAISSSDLNTAKTIIWQNNLKSLLYEVLPNIHNHEETNLVLLELSFIQNSHFILSPSLIESILITISKINSHCKNFAKGFNLNMSLLEALIKHRKTVIMDYLPPYLQRYRAVLKQLCCQSNTDLKLGQESIEQLADCAHKFERLTKSLATCDKSVMRLSPYIIADILNQFEKVTLYPNIKIHLNNSVYQLLSLCDEHSIAFLKRVLSTASTEMFKIVYENYNKYYKFTGKV